MNKSTSICSIFIFILTIVGFPNLLIARTYFEDFDDVEALVKDELDKHGGCYEHSFKLVDAPKRPGKNEDGKALQVHLKGWEKNEACKDWSVGKSRAEIRFGKGTQAHGFAEGQPVIISWHMYFPASFPTDSGRIIIAQVIENGPGPELDFFAGNGKLEVQRAWSVNGVKQKAKIHRQKLPLDTWIHAAVYLNRSSKSDGQIKIWIDSEEVADVKGPNVLIGYPEHVKGPYFKAGAYFGRKHRDSEYSVLFDDIVIVNP